MTTPQRSFEIKFRFKTGDSGTKSMIIQATDKTTARKIFEQQNPACVVSMVQEVKQ